MCPLGGAVDTKQPNHRRRFFCAKRLNDRIGLLITQHVGKRSPGSKVCVEADVLQQLQEPHEEPGQSSLIHSPSAAFERLLFLLHLIKLESRFHLTLLCVFLCLE